MKSDLTGVSHSAETFRVFGPQGPMHHGAEASLGGSLRPAFGERCSLSAGTSHPGASSTARFHHDDSMISTRAFSLGGRARALSHDDTTIGPGLSLGGEARPL